MDEHELFEVNEQKIGKYGTYLDTDRTLIVAEKVADREASTDTPELVTSSEKT